MDDKHHSANTAKDVSVANTVGASTPSTPTTATAVDLYTRRSCPRCGRRMSSLQFDKHTVCDVCRDMKCSLATRCKECKAWSKEFMLGYVKHQHSLVAKGKRNPPSPSPSPPVTVVAPTSLDTSSSELFSEDRLRQLMHSMFKDLLPASVGTNPSSTAPSAVPDSATRCTEATGGLQSVTPFEAPSMESPGVVLPTTSGSTSPLPHTVSVCVSYVDRSGFSNLGGPLNSGVGITISVSRGMDQLCVVNVAPSAVTTVASALSPGSLLFPFSDSGFASSSSRPFALPPPPPLPSVALSSSSISSLASSSFSSSLPFSPSPPPPPPTFPSPLAPPASCFPSSYSLSASAAVRPPPGFAPLPPPGFVPLTPSLSPLSSSAFSSASAIPSFSSSLPRGCVSFLAGLAPPVLSSFSFSSPPLDFASYQASMLGLSQDYQSCALVFSVWGFGFPCISFCLLSSPFF